MALEWFCSLHYFCDSILDFTYVKGKCFRWFQWQGTEFDVNGCHGVGSVAAVYKCHMEGTAGNDCIWLHDLPRNRCVWLVWHWIYCSIHPSSGYSFNRILR